MFTDYQKRKERNSLTSWRHIVTILLDRECKYGVFISHELALFLYIFLRMGLRNRYKNTFLKCQTDVHVVSYVKK